VRVVSRDANRCRMVVESDVCSGSSRKNRSGAERASFRFVSRCALDGADRSNVASRCSAPRRRLRQVPLPGETLEFRFTVEPARSKRASTSVTRSTPVAPTALAVADTGFRRKLLVAATWRTAACGRARPRRPRRRNRWIRHSGAARRARLSRARRGLFREPTDDPGPADKPGEHPARVFAHALDWLAARPEVDPTRIWVVAFPEEAKPRCSSALISLNACTESLRSFPSDVSHCVFGTKTPELDTPTAEPSMLRAVERNDAYDEPAAIIPVERIKGPVVTVCGGGRLDLPSLRLRPRHLRAAQCPQRSSTAYLACLPASRSRSWRPCSVRTLGTQPHQRGWIARSQRTSPRRRLATIPTVSRRPPMRNSVSAATIA